jgi:hypothetical protein
MSDHKEKDTEAKKRRGLSRRAQLRQQQRSIETQNLRIKDCFSIIRKLASDLKEALRLTPSEKSQLAHQEQGRMQALNAKICEIGACIHKEHRK